MTDVERNISVVRSLYDRFNAGDLDGICALCSGTVELLDVSAGQVFQGHEGVFGWMQVWKTAAPDAWTEVTTIIADGDCVVTEHIGRGTQTGPVVSPTGEIPPTGRFFELRFAEIFELKEGKIERLRAYTDALTFLRQVGVIE